MNAQYCKRDISLFNGLLAIWPIQLQPWLLQSVTNFPVTLSLYNKITAWEYPLQLRGNLQKSARSLFARITPLCRFRIQSFLSPSLDYIWLSKIGKWCGSIFCGTERIGKYPLPSILVIHSHFGPDWPYEERIHDLVTLLFVYLMWSAGIRV